MKKYKVVIEEKLTKIIEVVANCPKEAQYKVNKMWDDSEIVLDSSDFSSVNIIPTSYVHETYFVGDEEGNEIVCENLHELADGRVAFNTIDGELHIKNKEEIQTKEQDVPVYGYEVSCES